MSTNPNHFEFSILLYVIFHVTVASAVLDTDRQMDKLTLHNHPYREDTCKHNRIVSTHRCTYRQSVGQSDRQACRQTGRQRREQENHTWCIRFWLLVWFKFSDTTMIQLQLRGQLTSSCPATIYLSTASTIRILLCPL